MTADVSVIVPAWRAEATLARAVESALMQEGVGVEVIVVDDASPDGTFAEAERLATDSRVIALKQDVNQGPSAARNRALEVATGTYVTPLDSDDFMEPHRLARLVEIARAEDLDAVADDLLTVSEDDIDGPRTRHFSQSEIGLRTIDLPAFITGNLVAHHGGRGEMGYVKPLIRNAFLDEHGIRYDEDMRLGEDFALYCEILAKGAAFVLTDPAGYIAVRRTGSLSDAHGAREIGALVQADRRLLADRSIGAEAREALQRHYIETLKNWHWLRMIDAVKARSPGAFLACFAAPPSVALSLLGNLWEQMVVRTGRRFMAAPADGGGRDA